MGDGLAVVLFAQQVAQLDQRRLPLLGLTILICSSSISFMRNMRSAALRSAVMLRAVPRMRTSPLGSSSRRPRLASQTKSSMRVS